MQRLLGIVASAALALAACASPSSWPERADVSIESVPGRLAALGTPAALPGPRDLMLCIVDARGEAQCHHQAGVLAARVNARGAATCAGADVQLRSPCAGANGCRFPAVPVPGGVFGLLVVELRPLAFGMPRHAVVESAVVSGGTAHDTELEVARTGVSLTALARCLAPTSIAETDTAQRLRVDRGACQDTFCELRRTRLKLATRPGGSVAGLPAAQPTSR
jgi:hypothetical protein